MLRFAAFLSALLLVACTSDAPTPVSQTTPAASPQVIRMTAKTDAALATAYEALSEGDRSTIAALLQQPEAALLTVEGSANDRFWLILVDQGWGRAVPVEPKVVEQMPEARSYAFAPFGNDKLAAWFRSYFARRDG